jgi:hypothetical protein
MEFDSKVAGIPCVIRVTYYKNVAGSYDRNAPSDLDYYGYTEAEFVVCDQRGRPAPWLEAKLTKEERDRVISEISDAYSSDYL